MIGPARTLMVLGTASDVGKSTMVAGLCRALSRRGVHVAPFKAQNMARNAYVCSDGGEIGVAQAVQAIAAGVVPCVDHNPILLKPEPDLRSHVLVHGRPIGTFAFTQVLAQRPLLIEAATSSLHRLRAAHTLVVIEGAGSPAELNLQAHDLPNIATARIADADILLVADIYRGGVFASLLGTLDLLPADLRSRVRGLVVNKLRGDAALFASGVLELERRSGVPVLGVVPHLPISLPDEDSVALARHRGRPRAPLDAIEIAVVDTPALANFEDIAPLLHHAGVHVRLTADARELLEADAVVLLGSKSTVHDLAFLRERGLDRALAQRALRRQWVLGVCGGAQLLGERIYDPSQIESSEREIEALGLLPVVTRFVAPKRTRRVRGELIAGWGASADGEWHGEPLLLDGFELHYGRLERAPSWEARGARAALRLHDDSLEGCALGSVLGTMVHRLFDVPRTCEAFVAALRAERGLVPAPVAAPAPDPYDQLADALEGALDMPRLLQIALASPA